jgi:hypothetical protein
VVITIRGGTTAIAAARITDRAVDKATHSSAADSVSMTKKPNLTINIMHSSSTPTYPEEEKKKTHAR